MDSPKSIKRRVKTVYVGSAVAFVLLCGWFASSAQTFGVGNVTASFPRSSAITDSSPTSIRALQGAQPTQGTESNSSQQDDSSSSLSPEKPSEGKAVKKLQEINNEDYDYDYEEEPPVVVARTNPTPAPRTMGSSTPAATGSWRFPPDMPYLEALSTCETLKCVSDAHKQPKGDAKYNFPHFMIAGWSKSATTSLYQHLNDHPDILSPKEKEPMLFTDYCDFEGNKLLCTFNKQSWYVKDVLKLEQFVKAGGQVVPYEATPRIMDEGPNLAEIMYELFPWVKLVASLREPISRGMSKYIMQAEKFDQGCLKYHKIGWCLVNDREQKFGNPKKHYYSLAIKSWIDSMPLEQLHLIQYEDLIGPREEYELRRVKEFIGIDPNIPDNKLFVTDTNCRKCRIQPEGWDMHEKQYRKAIKMVMPDVMEVVRLVDKYKLGNGTRWLENWQQIWEDNLATCVDGMCKIKLS